SDAAEGELVLDGDLEITSAPTDFLAVQYYGATGAGLGGQQVTMFPTSNASWQQIHAEGLYDLLVRLKDDYPAMPIIITENGIPDESSDLTVKDPYRVSF